MRGFLKSVVLSALVGFAPTIASAQNVDTIVVFDGPGSMWGQINGKTKIEIARETLSTVLTEIPAQTRIGMIAYGHRQKGVCEDIENVVPVGPAVQSVPRMIDVANKLQPKGKTPLSDSVRIAAEELKFTENAATVILVTDGIETCDADPCALGRELEAAGIGFTAHVVGFGLSEEEGRQVQCLADNTGGLYLSANDADELSDALRRTVQVDPEPAPPEPPEVVAREVHFFFRDVDGGDLLGARNLEVLVEPAENTMVQPASFGLNYPEAARRSATGSFEPGSYVALIRRNASSGDGYRVRYEFEVPEGEGVHVIEASLSGQLTINTFVNPNLPYVHGEPFPSSIGGSGPRIWYQVFAVDAAGAVAEEPAAEVTSKPGAIPLPPGRYLIRGNIDRTTTAERLVEVHGATEFDFSFDATRVFVEARETDGFPVKRQTTYWYDKVPSGRNYWRSGRGVSDGEVTPFYLPTGTWVVNVGGEGYGDRRSELMIKVPGDFEDMRLRVGEGAELSDDQKAMLESADYSGCVDIVAVRHNGCLVEKVDLGASQ
ncbi:MAG: VWA domain-containing protein [Pseudomonadota bacterium]